MTMELALLRDIFSPEFTLGILAVDDRFLGYTEEDEDRYLERHNQLIPGFVIRSFADRRKRPHGYEYKERRQTRYREAAIPRGKYHVVTSWSARFREMTPEILGVPEFIGVRIISEDRSSMSTGCILIGSRRDEFGVGDTAEVVRHLLALIQEAEANQEEVCLTVR